MHHLPALLAKSDPLKSGRPCAAVLRSLLCGKALLDHVKLRLQHPGAEKTGIDQVDTA